MMRVMGFPKGRERSLSHTRADSPSVGSARPLLCELEKGQREKSQSGSFCWEETMVHEAGDE